MQGLVYGESASHRCPLPAAARSVPPLPKGKLQIPFCLAQTVGSLMCVFFGVAHTRKALLRHFREGHVSSALQHEWVWLQGDRWCLNWSPWPSVSEEPSPLQRGMQNSQGREARSFVFTFTRSELKPT